MITVNATHLAYNMKYTWLGIGGIWVGHVAKGEINIQITMNLFLKHY